MKLSMLPNAAAELASWTWSPRLRHNFKQPLKFVFVDSVVARRPPIIGQEKAKTVVKERSGLYAPALRQARKGPEFDKGMRKFERSCERLISPTITAKKAAEVASASDVQEDEPREISDKVAYRHAELAVLLHASAM
jgi:hypothetical protein